MNTKMPQIIKKSNEIMTIINRLHLYCVIKISYNLCKQILTTFII